VVRGLPGDVAADGDAGITPPLAVLPGLGKPSVPLL
jgi:hypothetical protein